MEAKKFYRSNKNRIFAGVCGGISDYFNIDPVIVRILWVIVTFCSFGAGLLGYVIVWVIVPEEYAVHPGKSGRSYGYLWAIGIIILLCIVIAFIPIGR